MSTRLSSRAPAVRVREQLMVEKAIDSTVLLSIPPNTRWMKFGPKDAVNIAHGILRTALACGADKPDWYVG